MKSVLHVGAIVDSRTPAAWVIQLLHNIEQHELMLLSVVDESATTDTPSGSHHPPRQQMDDWLLDKLIDHPQFTHNPWEPTALPASLIDRIPDHAQHVFDTCDIVLNLTRSAVSGTFAAPVWTANLTVLDQRIKHCLLNRTPFIWIHIWSMQARIASHSLPCQTFSISDLRRLTYSSLPNFFMSRLTWLANSTERKLDSIDSQASNQGVFEEDHKLASADAVSAINANIDPSNIQQISNIAKAIRVLARKTYERLHHKLFSERWQLGVAVATPSKPHTLASISQHPVHTYDTVATPKDVVWADPHLCEYKGDVYAFFERMRLLKENAHIAYAKLDAQGKPVDIGTALSTDHHLSFPFVFHHDNDVYMIPETASQREVSLYKATQFPDQWERAHVLLQDINAADTIMIRHKQRWWLFTNCQSHRSVDERDELHIFYANTLQGPWQPHALNPVITGVDRSRMAGPIIEEDGDLYRSSQYGAYRYGYGINISRIDELSPTTYRESAFRRILPEKGAGWSGCHSLTRAGNLVMIDRVRFSRK